MLYSCTHMATVGVKGLTVGWILRCLIRVGVVVQHTLGDCEDMYFVESEARTVMEDYQRTLGHITRAIRARNSATSILYENLIPSWIPNSQYSTVHYCNDVSEQ